MIRTAKAALLAGMTLIAMPAFAQGPPPNEDGRYTFEKVDDGYLRFDERTGHVSFCAQRKVGWACQVAPEDRAALEEEIARLQVEVGAVKTENMLLRERLAAAGGTPPAAQESPAKEPPVASAPPQKQDELTIKMPTREDVAWAKTYLKDAWQRLVEKATALHKDLMRKAETPARP